MKYSEMNEEQKAAYKQKQIDNQRKARELAKRNTIVLTITLNNPTDAMIQSIKAIVEGK